jgi:two-component system sensor histidine kinase UhpB
VIRLEKLAAPSAVPWGLVVFACAFLAQGFTATAGTIAGAGEVIWLAGGALLAALMRLPRNRWLACVIGAWAGIYAAQAWVDTPPPAFDLKTLATLVLVSGGAYLLLALFDTANLRRNFRCVLAFLAVFVICVPALSATLWVLVAPAPSLHDHLPSQWLQIALAHGLGYMLFAPLWLIVPADSAAPRPWHDIAWWPLVDGLGAAVVIGLLWIAFEGQEHTRLLLLLAPILTLALAAMTGHAAGAYVFVLSMTLIAVTMTATGHGPFLEEHAFLSLLYVKSWIFVLALLAWLLILLIEQRVQMQGQLDDSSREVRELAGRLFEAQEQERSRIARDLHDDINQRLALVSIELSALRRHVSNSDQLELEHIQDELIALSEDIRDISHNLHPSMLQETGLKAALGSLCGAQRHPNGPSISVHVTTDADNLPSPIALCIYRATQEALSNAIRHARARNIEVRLRTIPPETELTIDDDGIGFDAGGEHAHRHGLGLFSLEERAKLAGGEFHLITSQGKGTHICIRIPLPH